MAIKSREELKTQSTTTFPDNETGSIIPANHRTFNDDVLDSVLFNDDVKEIDITNQVTKTNNISVPNMKIFRYDAINKKVCFNVSVNISATIGSGTNLIAFTIPEEYCPKASIGGGTFIGAAGTWNANWYVGSNGNFYLSNRGNAAIPATTLILISGFYYL